MEYTSLLKSKYFFIKIEDKVTYFYSNMSHLKFYFKLVLFGRDTKAQII